jgi:hypothetical protein
VLGLLLCWLEPARAHVPQLRGRLVDLVSQSDLIVVGTVDGTRAIEPRRHDTTVRVEGRFGGEPTPPILAFRSARRFAPGKRFVFFLRRDGTGLVCMQPSGTVFASRPDDDAAYRQTISAIQRALRAGVGQRTAALRAAIIPALSATSPALRHHAVLELGALAHHPLTDSERRALERIAADPATDAAIRLIVTSLLGAAAPAQPAAGDDGADGHPCRAARRGYDAAR